MRRGPLRAVILTTATAAAVWVLAAAGGLAFQGQTASYTMYASDGRRAVVVRTGTKPETLALEQLAGPFGLTFTEDRAAGGLVIGTRRDRIYASPGQSFVRAAGKVIALDGPVQRERNAWVVPIDFLTKALGPALGQPIVVRPASRLILVGNVRVPELTIRAERTSTGARLVITIEPATLHRVTREGNRLTVRFDAVALDAAPAMGLLPEFVPSVRVDGPNLTIDLGPETAAHRAGEDRATGALTIDLLTARALAPPKPPPAPPPAPVAPAPSPRLDVPAAGLRTIVLDPGHGGEDAGATGAGGTMEKDVTLAVARRLKAAIEARLGLRVLMTRDGDDTVSPDRRTELANNNKADAFVSLHANWSVRPDARGAQVYMPSGDQPLADDAAAGARKLTVPVVGGGSRVIDPVPWELAQLPFVSRSSTLAAVLARQLGDRGVPLFVRPTVRAPMRVLMGANMPAVLVEMAFLSNADDERALAGGERQAALVEAVLAALSELRRGIPAGQEAR